MVERIVRACSIEDRLVGYRYRPRWGGVPAYLYSVKEVARLLSDKYPAISLARLEQWLRGAIRDVELADGVAEAVENERSDRERFRRVRALLDERLAQCKVRGVG